MKHRLNDSNRLLHRPVESTADSGQPGTLASTTALADELPIGGWGWWQIGLRGLSDLLAAMSACNC
ncbi:hypothetical protein, partial [Silvimonas amylolytica]|uniref:hypothetical protein n=1 Tax=Silvimonas amylolytica TaxID=449663 RepID=UPI001E4BADB5